MPFPLLIPLITAGVSALGGALSNKKSARTTTTSTADTTPEYKTLGDMLRNRIESRLRSSVDLGGYEAGGIGAINDAFGGAETALNADLTSRGLGTSPIAGTASGNLQAERGTNIAQFLNTLPQVRRQMENEDISAANQFYQARPRTTTTVGPGSAAGGALDNIASFLGYLYRQKALGAGDGL
jgi:hypothetical protein